MRWSNCYVYAARQWSYGWQVRLVKSKWGWWPHAQASPDGVVWYEFVPERPRRRLVPPVIFRGRVKRVRT